MFGILQSQAPAKQTATEAISILSNRLLNGRLLEDRRAATLGLRSFAKEYPASVASGALRSLIGSLSKDGSDVDTVKIVLETLLVLFSPNKNSPEASEELSLWLADEFTQRQENITSLLDLLNNNDFYLRLYSLQLLAAIQSARLERTQECVFTAPLGISRLVSVLDDRREAIRNEGLLLLISLTPSSTEFQKLVAFENGFDRIISLMLLEGGLSHGGVTIQDCLSLLANLLRFNVSNQSLFRETGCVPKFAELISGAVSDLDDDDVVAGWVKPQRDKNLWGTLVALRLFLVHGGLGTQMNQQSWWNGGVTQQVLSLGFGINTALAVRAEALITCADLIRGNAKAQEGFAQLQVNHLTDELLIRRSPTKPETTPVQVNVIHGLLDLAIEVSSGTFFDVRLAACECLKAYLYHHEPIRLQFLQRTIEGYQIGSDETANPLVTLLTNKESRRSVDPYRVWLASVLLSHILYEDHEAKLRLMQVTEGDASAGEEVVTCIQALTGMLVTGLQHGEDERVSIGYAMLLCTWLFEDPDAVNDFLEEGSSLQSLLQATVQGGAEAVLVQGMCTVLLGIVYEFSSKDSPVARATIHQIICSSLGREQYIDKLTKLREHPILRDFEVIHQGLGDKHLGGLAEVYFDRTFVNFLKDHFSRLLRAVDRDPGMEISVVTNGVQKGISRELVDTLRLQVEDNKQALQKAESEVLNLERILGQEQAERRRAKEMAALELSRIRIVNENLHKNHEDELGRAQRAHHVELEQLRTQYQDAAENFQQRLQRSQTEAENRDVRLRETHEVEVADLKFTIQKLERELEKASKDHVQDLETAHEEYTTKLSAMEARVQSAEAKAEEAERRAKLAVQRADDLAKSATAAKEAQTRSEGAGKKAQAELEDLLIVLADIEEQRAKDKKRLKSLGEVVSDDSEGEEDLKSSQNETQEETGTNGAI